MAPEEWTSRAVHGPAAAVQAPDAAAGGSYLSRSSAHAPILSRGSQLRGAVSCSSHRLGPPLPTALQLKHAPIGRHHLALRSSTRDAAQQRSCSLTSELGHHRPVSAQTDCAGWTCRPPLVSNPSAATALSSTAAPRRCIHSAPPPPSIHQITHTLYGSLSPPHPLPSPPGSVERCSTRTYHCKPRAGQPS